MGDSVRCGFKIFSNPPLKVISCLTRKFYERVKTAFALFRGSHFVCFKLSVVKGSIHYPRKTCNHYANHFSDSPYSGGLVVKQVDYFDFNFKALEGVRDTVI